MTRDELIDAGARMLTQSRALGHPDSECARRVIETVEPLIRADEREFLAPEVPFARDDLRNELRAKVAALTTEYDSAVEDYVSRADVLALFDGE